MASAAALGVSEPTLRTWVQNVSTDARGSLRRVVVTPSTEAPATKLPRSATKLSGSSRLTLVTPTGYRLRGLDVASAAALLRVLG
jgi:transposase-like protein